MIDAIAKTVAELTSQQDGVIRQQVIEELMQQIMHYDGEFRREEATSVAGFTRSPDTVRIECSARPFFTPSPSSTPGSPRSGRHPSGASAHERQFFRMMQSPPAAFNPLHNFAAFSADAKGPTSAR